MHRHLWQLPPARILHIDHRAPTLLVSPIVGRFSKIDKAVSRYEYRPTQARQIDNYPGGLEQMERRSPFPTNDSVLCRGRDFRSEHRSVLTTTTAKCQHALVIEIPKAGMRSSPFDRHRRSILFDYSNSIRLADRWFAITI